MTGAGSNLDQAVSQALAKEFESNPVGDMRRLGPSLSQTAHPDHVFRADANGITVGSRVPYLTNYERATGRDVLFLTDEGRKRVAEVLKQWVLDGR